MSNFQNTIDLLGDDVVAAQLVWRKVEEFNDNVITKIGANAFGGSGSKYSNYNIKKIRLPNLTSSGQYAFGRCDNLTLVDLGKITNIYKTFLTNKQLNTIILRSQTVCTLSLSDLNGTPFASNGTGGTVYCPASLITEYQNATNWSSLYAAGTCNFVAIEGSEYE
jgi:hypothetical protein